MENRILLVEEVIKRVRAGYPTGIDDESFKQIPILLKRIEELERALVPFARIGAQVDSYSNELLDCYAKDCVCALQMIDKAYSYRKPVENFGQPAES